MSITFSLAEAINQLSGLVGGEIASDLVSKLEDRSFRRRVAALVEQQLRGGTSRRGVARLLKEREFYEALAASENGDAKAKERLVTLLRKAGVSESNSAAIESALTAAFVRAAHEMADPVGSLTLARVAAVEELVSHNLQVSLDTYNAVTRPPTEGDVDLALLDAKSRIVADDAGLVAADARLSDGLYVERSEVQARLADTPPGSIAAVVGDAGVGKTSVLWAEHSRRLQRGETTWLVRASQLFANSLGGQDFAATLQKAASWLTEVSPVILVDSVDHLMHSDEEREAFTLFARAVVEVGASLIVACRPRESRLLPAEVINHPLSVYSDDELSTAISNHESVFASASSEGASVHDLMDAVRWDTPMLPVLKRPLTLRMLFELYSPETLPVEINTFELYSTFWVNRVCTDNRGGAPGTLDSTNYSNAADAIATELLALGRPSLVSSHIATLVGVSQSDIAALRSRSALGNDETVVEFFHQSFFEHAAGRSIAVNGGWVAVSALLERAESRPEDSFLWPVVEQALLYSLNLRLDDENISRHLKTWLTATSSGLGFIAAVGVWTQASNELEDLSSYVAELVADSHYPDGRAETLLQAAQAVSSARRGEGLSVLEAALTSTRPARRRIAVRLLPSFAATSPLLVRDLLARFETRGGILDDANLGFPEIAATLALIARSDETSAAQEALSLLEQLGSTGNLCFHLFDSLLENFDHYDAYTFEERWLLPLTAHAKGMSPTRVTSLVEAVRAAKELTSAEALAHAATLEGELGVAWLRAACKAGVADRGHETEDDDADLVESILALPLALLTKAVDAVAELIEAQPETFRHLLVSVVAGATEPEPGRVRSAARILAAVSMPLLVQHLAAVPDQREELWLDHQRLEPLFFALAVAGHAELRSLLDKILTGPPNRTQRRAAAALESRAHLSSYAMSHFVRMALEVDDGKQIARLAQMLHEQPDLDADAWRSAMSTLASMDDPSSAKSLKLRSTLIEVGIDAEAALPPVAHLPVPNASNTAHQLLQVLTFRVHSGLADPELALEYARRSIDVDKPNLDDAIYLAVLSSTRIQDLQDAWIAASDLLDRDGVTAREIRSVRRLLTDLAATDPDGAADRLRHVVKRLPQLSDSQKHQSANGLFEPLVETFRSLPSAQRSALFVEVCTADYGLATTACLALRAATTAQFVDVANQLVSNPHLSDDARQQLLLDLSNETKTLGSAGWPEIRSLLR